MTLNELIAQLQTMVEQNEILGEAEVLIAHQPSYPLAVQIDVLTADYTDGDADPVIWIAAGDHPGSKRSPYAPKHAWDGGEVFADADEDDDEDDRGCAPSGWLRSNSERK